MAGHGQPQPPLPVRRRRERARRRHARGQRFGEGHVLHLAIRAEDQGGGTKGRGGTWVYGLEPELGAGGVTSSARVTASSRSPMAA